MKMNKIVGITITLMLCMIVSGCAKKQDTRNNAKMTVAESQEIASYDDFDQMEASSIQDTDENQNVISENTISKNSSVYKPVNSNAIVKKESTYDCNLDADRKNYDGHVDIVVGDNLYATQMNDWFMNFEQYEGKVIEIEGYYIGDFKPYDFIGRYGPTCPYCQGGYVCFEILSDEDFSQYVTAKDWIKVTGILREGNDASIGPFYYIEVLELNKMKEVGQDTVTN
ncbi:MAG: hypothetical protein PHY47_07765 [Lachnospiraceae bacterium]|nr:hypothetical protein [Lachnospiraceae bacterium]